MDADHLVRFTRRDESQEDALLRVYRFCQWIREIEVDDYERVLSAKTQNVYEPLLSVIA